MAYDHWLNLSTLAQKAGVDMNCKKAVTKFHKDLFVWLAENMQRERDYDFCYESVLWKFHNGEISFPRALYINNGEHMLYLRLKFGV
jgi:hypothetical protein